MRSARSELENRVLIYGLPLLKLLLGIQYLFIADKEDESTISGR